MSATVTPIHPTTTPEAFDLALARLETEVSIPVVAGDGRRWCQDVLTALREVDSAWQHHAHTNRQTMKRTMKTDIELAGRVEKLATRETELTQQLDLLGRKTRVLDERARSSEGGEEPTKAVEEVRTEWLSWIVSCRALTKEIQTWFMEANYRDVGGGD
jgi:hypothetical protein